MTIVELRQLRYFLAVADELHFSRAAERLLIAAPSLSQQIKVLERLLKVQLFVRSPAGVSLTDAGRQLLPAARATVAAAEEMTTLAAQLAGGRSEELRLGFQSFAFTAAARELLTAFGRRHPEVEIQLRQYEWDDPSAGLLDGAVDMAVVRTPFRGAETLRTVELEREPVLLVAAAGHPLTRRDRVGAADVAGTPFLETTLVTDPVFAAHWYLRDLRTAEPVRSRSATVEEWLGEIALGRGVNIIPAGFAQEYAKPGLAFVPIDGLPESSVVLAWRPDRITAPIRDLARLAAREASRTRS